jgi:hypothetical protein
MPQCNQRENTGVYHAARRSRRAQQPAMPVIGFLTSGTPAGLEYLTAAFRQGLGEAGLGPWVKSIMAKGDAHTADLDVGYSPAGTR